MSTTQFIDHIVGLFLLAHQASEDFCGSEDSPAYEQAFTDSIHGALPKDWLADVATLRGKSVTPLKVVFQALNAVSEATNNEQRQHAIGLARKAIAEQGPAFIDVACQPLLDKIEDEIDELERQINLPPPPDPDPIKDRRQMARTPPSWRRPFTLTSWTLGGSMVAAGVVGLATVSTMRDAAWHTSNERNTQLALERSRVPLLAASGAMLAVGAAWVTVVTVLDCRKEGWHSRCGERRSSNANASVGPGFLRVRF